MSSETSPLLNDRASHQIGNGTVSVNNRSSNTPNLATDIDSGGLYNYVGRHRSFAIRNQARFASACILLSVVFEKIAFYGLVGNLVLFLNLDPFNWLPPDATNALYIFTAISFITSLIGGWIADSCLGKYKTILLFFIIYTAGYICMPFLAKPHLGRPKDSYKLWCDISYNDPAPIHNGSSLPTFDFAYDGILTSSNDHSTNQGDQRCQLIIYVILLTIAFGTGGIKANVAPFGADQVKIQGVVATRVFFNWYYWCINIGSLLALGVLGYIQQDVGFFPGYLIPVTCVVLSAIIFGVGYCAYVMKHPSGSIIINIFRVLREACQMSCRRRSHYNTQRSSIEDLDNDNASCLDFAKVQYGGSFHDSTVDDVKKLGKIFCVFLALIPYWTVYFQMSTTFVIQGLHMKIDFINTTTLNHESTFQVPAAWLSLFDVIFLIMLIPLFDRVIYPALDRRGWQLSLRARIVIGMVFAVVAIALAGGLEAIRRARFFEDYPSHVHNQTIANKTYSAADISILYQIPQYALIGTSEVFASVAGLELAYIHAPRSMQSLIMGLFSFCQGLGSLLGGAAFSSYSLEFLQQQTNKTDSPDVFDSRKSHLDYYFFILAGVQFAAIFLFIFITWKLDIGQGAPARHNKHSPNLSPSGATNNRRPSRTNAGSLRIPTNTSPTNSSPSPT